jgi:hypothetical protein
MIDGDFRAIMPSSRIHADCNAILNSHIRSLLAQFGLNAEVQTRAGCGGEVGDVPHQNLSDSRV